MRKRIYGMAMVLLMFLSISSGCNQMISTSETNKNAEEKEAISVFETRENLGEQEENLISETRENLGEQEENSTSEIGENSEKKEIISVDLTKDGSAENIFIVKISEEEYELQVKTFDGEILWSASAGTVHVGWTSIFLYTSDNESYLLQYNPTVYQGIANYSYTLFDLEGGGENIIDFKMIEFDINDDRIITPEMTAFTDNLKALLENSILLISTLEGEVIIGPIVGVTEERPYWKGQ